MKIKTVTYGKQLRKDLKLAVKRGYDISKLDEVIDLLCCPRNFCDKEREQKF